MHFENANSSTRFTDTRGHAWTVSNGTPSISTTQSKFGNSSLFCGTTGDNKITTAPQTAYDIGTGDFTVEAWIRPSSFGGNTNNTNMIFCRQNNMILQVSLNSTGHLQCALKDSGGGGTTSTVGATALTTNVWTAIAVTRTSGTVRVFVNGTVDASSTGNTQSLTDIGASIFIGGETDANAGYYGYIDEVRFTAQSLYSGGYFTASAPFADASLLLMHFDGTNGSTTFTDVYNHVFSVGAGSPTLSTTQAKFGPSSLSLNGSADISTPMAGDLQPGAGDFTIECFVYLSSVSVNNDVMSNWHTGVATTSSYIFRLNSTGHAELSYGVGGTNASVSGSSVTVSTNTWTHVAVVIADSTASLFVGGTKDATTGALGGALNINSGTSIFVGGQDSTPNGGLNGFMDELRVSGFARYTANFTPPSSPFTS